MKLSEVKRIGSTPDEFDEKKALSSSSRTRGSIVLEIGKSKREAAENIFRPVGNAVSRPCHRLTTWGLCDLLDLPEVVVCPSFTFPGEIRCPICAYGFKQWRKGKDEGDEELEDKSKRILPRDRHHLIVIPRGIEEVRAEWISFTLMAYEGYVDSYEKYGAPGDPDDGYDMILKAWYKGQYPQYSFEPRMRKKTKNSRVVGIAYTPLTEEERDLVFPDVESFFTELEREDVKRVREILFSESSIESLAGSDSGGSEKLPLACFGDQETYDPEDDVCIECPHFENCTTTIEEDEIPF